MKKTPLQAHRDTNLRLIIIAMLISFRMSAATWTDFGSYDISWFDNSKSEFVISTPQQLAGVAYLINNNFTSFSNKTLYLSADIDLNGKLWTPIGTSSTTFQGNLDGQGHSIKSITVKDCYYYKSGFWLNLSDAKVSNVSFDIHVSKLTDPIVIGSIAASASSVEFNNIKVKNYIDVSITSISTNTDYTFTYIIGGSVGESSNCTYKNINSTSNILFTFGSSDGNNCYGAIDLNVGGIVGGGSNDIFEKCEIFNNFDIGINGYVTSISYTGCGNSYVTCGGIAGRENDDNYKIISCLAHNNSFMGNHYNGTYDTLIFRFGGLVGSMGEYGSSTLQNSVAINDSYKITGHDYSSLAAFYHTDSYFGGIGGNGVAKNYAACYSNNDTYKSISKIRTNSTGENGSTSLSTSQMNSQPFVDELNVYSRMQYGTNNWELDENGNLSILHDDENAGIEDVEKAINNEIIGIYSIDGIRLNQPAKGINIMIYSDGSSKKVIIK